MKIKLSKSQWEGIGKKAGWMKEAQLMGKYYLGYFDMSGFFAVADYSPSDGIVSVEPTGDGHWEGGHPKYFQTPKEAEVFANTIKSDKQFGYKDLSLEVCVDGDEHNPY